MKIQIIQLPKTKTGDGVMSRSTIPDNGVIDWVNVGAIHPNTGSSTGTDSLLLSKTVII